MNHSRPLGSTDGGVRIAPPQRSRRARYRELKREFAALHKNYVNLHAALFEASQVHRRLCAPRHVQYGGFEIASEVFAVRYLPGDFFAVEECRGGLIFALGDVCGKGLAAGMWTPCLVGLVRAHAGTSSKPEAIVAAVNREFCRMHAPLTSLFLGRLDPAGTVDYCSAGHPLTLLLRAGGELQSLSRGGMLLGMADDARFESGRVELGAGDLLLAYTDGVVEARNQRDEEFGTERLEGQLRLSAGGSTEAVLFSVLAAVQDFAGVQPLTDDTSVVVVSQVPAIDPLSEPSES